MSTVPAVLTAAGEAAIALEKREVEAVRRILFFDGVCGLCNWSVDFVLKRDKSDDFQFAPLQGETARAFLTAQDIDDLSSVVLWVDSRTYRKSAAVVRVLWRLNFGWRLVGTLLWLVPLPLRNWGYRLVAKNRYQFFGRKETCRLPTIEERAKILP